MLRRLSDRTGMEVVTDEFRIWESLRHQHGGPAMTASHIGDGRPAVQFVNDALKSRKPVWHEVVVITWAEEAGDGAEHAASEVAPFNPPTCLEGVLNLRLGLQQRRHQVESAE